MGPNGNPPSPRPLSMLFLIVTVIFVVIICSNIVYSSTMQRALEEQGKQLALSGLLEALGIAHPLAEAAQRAGLSEPSDLLAAIDRPLARDQQSGAFLPFVMAGEDRRVAEGAHLPDQLAAELPRRLQEGAFATQPFRGSSYESAQVCQVALGTQIWMAAAVPLNEGQIRLGYAREITPFIQRARSIQQKLLGLLVLCQVFFLVAFVLVMRIITIPLRALTGAADKFARGKFDLPVPVPQTMMSEVRVLASAFNNMGTELKTQHESLQAYSRELEDANQKLKDALDELSNRNRHLRAMTRSSLEANKLAMPDQVLELIVARVKEDAGIAHVALYSFSAEGRPKRRRIPGLDVPDDESIPGDVLDCIQRCRRELCPRRLPAQVLPDGTMISTADGDAETSAHAERLYFPVVYGINRIEVFEFAGGPGGVIDLQTEGFLRHFISHMEVILKNKALYLETIRRSHELERIHQISRHISGELDMDRLLRDVVDHTQNTIRAECVFVGVLEGGQVQIRHITPGSATIDEWVIDTSDSPLLNELVRKAHSILVDEIATHPKLSQDDLIRKNDFRSVVGCPIIEKDEVIGVLCGFSSEPAAFSENDGYFLGLLAGQVAIALSNARLFEEILARDKRRDHQLKVAQNLQKNRIPSYFKQNVAAVSCQLRAADELAGDFCDVFSLGRHSLALVVGDVANKGVAASLMTFSLLSMFRNLAKTHKPPCEIMESINRSLISQIKEDCWFATAFYGRLNTKKGTLTYSSAGHEKPLWFHSQTGEVDMLDAAGYPLGLFRAFPYETREIEIEQGDRIVFYTDGVTDAMSPEGNRFGHEALRDLVAHSGHLSGAQLTQAIVSRVEEFTGGKRQRDDIIVAVLELEDDPWIHKVITFPELSDLVNEILDALAPYNLEKQTTYAIRLALDESITNAWRHGLDERSDLRVDISYLISDEGFQFRVKDPGFGFDHESLPDPTVPENLFKTNGRGVFLMRQMMDDVDFNEMGNEITVIKRFPPHDADDDEESYDALLIDRVKQLVEQQESLDRAKQARLTGRSSGGQGDGEEPDHVSTIIPGDTEEGAETE